MAVRIDVPGRSRGGTGCERVLIVSPVRNEAPHIERTVRAMAEQSRPPDRWVVVDDGSDDGTYELLRKLAPQVPFMRVLAAPGRPTRRGADRLQAALEAIAFNWALESTDVEGFTHLGKLDGDIELPAHYFAELLSEFRADPRLGIAGGALVEPFAGRWRRLRPPDYHVHGAVKLYSAECFHAIGGIQERLGWDTIDETYARMRGFRTRSITELVARHHRPSASQGGRLRGYARYGRCAHIVGYPAFWVALRALKEATKSPVGLAGAAFLYGYTQAAVSRAPCVEDQEFRRFVRAELTGRLRRRPRSRPARMSGGNELGRDSMEILDARSRS